MKKKLLTVAAGLFCMLLATPGIAQVPTASFSLSTSTVCVGDPIQITDLSSDTPDTWVYTFDGTSTSSMQNPSFTYTTAGVYTITLIATNPAGPSTEFTETVMVNALPNVSAGSDMSVCLGSTLALSGSGASTYSWTGGVTDGQSFAPSASAAYTVTGEDANGCRNTAVQSVTVNSLPVLSASGSTAVCLGSPVTQTVSGATTYTWSNGSNSDMISVMPATSGATAYVISGTDANGCSSTSTINVMVNALPVVSANSGTICTGASFVINASGALSYNITGGSATVSPATDASYTVTGTDANGCSAAAVSNVTVFALPVITANSGSICEGTSFVLSPNGASSYVITGGTATVSPLSDATYSIIGTDVNGCSSAAIIASVSVYALPVISVNSGSICAGSSFSINGSGAVSYTVSGGANVVSPSATANYTVTGESSQGCVSDAVTSTVTVVSLPVVSVNSGTICAGQSFTLSPSGAASFTISGGASVVSPATSTSYSVTGATAEGCLSSNMAVADITVSALPVLSVNSGSICQGSTFTLVPAGASTYSITGGNIVVSPAVTTSYSITGSDVSGCSAANAAVATITVSAAPVITVNSGSICAGQSFTMTANGAASYSFTGGNNVVAPSINTSYTVTGNSTDGCASLSGAVSNVTVIALPVLSASSGTICSGSSFNLSPAGASAYTITGGNAVVSPVTSTTYTINGENAAGCAAASAVTATVTVNALPLVAINSGSICAGSSFTLAPTGAVSFTVTGNTLTVSPSVNASYSVTGTDANGCVSSQAVANITVFALPVVAITSGTAICAGSSATLTANGANGYLWNTTATSSVLVVTPSSNTTYSVTGTDVNGCSGSASQLVAVNALPTITANGGAICPGNSFVLSPSGASSYTITGGSATVTPATTTSYTITGTDANGCEAQMATVATVSVVNTLTVTVTGANAICTGQTTSLTAGGASTYSWSNGATTSTLSISPTASSSYTVMGISGTCSNTTVFSLVVNQLPTITVNSGAVCSGSSFTIVPVGATNYTITGGATVVTPTISTSYSVTGTDANGCSAATAAVSDVTVNALPELTVSSTSGLICTGETATLTVSGASSYTWDQGANSAMLVVTPSLSTTYTVSGVDANGCAGSMSYVQNVSECLGLVANSKEVSYSVYPNPNNGSFVIELSQNSVISVINSLGQTLVSGSYEAGAHKMSLEGENQGVYFVQISQNGTSKTVKVIKN